MNRRQFLALASFAAPAFSCASAPPAPTPAPAAAAPVPEKGALVYVAGYRDEVSAFRFDTATGVLRSIGKTSVGNSPSFLAFDPKGRFVFAAHEVEGGQVSAFSVDRMTGGLSPLGATSSMGAGPAYVSVDRSGRFVLVSNYAHGKPGTVAVLPIGADGKLGAAVDKADFGLSTLPHSIVTDPTNKLLYVPCKGGPFVTALRFDDKTGRIEFADHDRVRDKPKGGPRHMAFHPSGKIAFVINELESSITAYSVISGSGRLDEIQTLSTLPEGWKGSNSGADIHVHPSGNFLYGSNRGHDSIAIFKLDAAGKMEAAGHEQRTIKTPRNFHVDPSGRWMLVANQGADTVTVFKIDPNSGALEQVGTPIAAGKGPSFVGILPGT